MKTVKSGYQFSTQLDQDGIKMDITIKTTREMAMSELMGLYAALSHGVYLEMAEDIKKSDSQENKVSLGEDVHDMICRVVSNFLYPKNGPKAGA